MEKKGRKEGKKAKYTGLTGLRKENNGCGSEEHCLECASVILQDNLHSSESS